MFERSIVSEPICAPKIVGLQREIPLNDETQSIVDEALLERAHLLCPAEYSCRDLRINPRGWRFIGFVLLVCLAIYLAPETVFIIILIWLMAASVATTVLRISALVASQRNTPVPRFLQNPKPVALKTISLLVPLFREGNVLQTLIKNLTALDYPSSHLEIKLLLEATDEDTQRALDNIALPENVSALIVPNDWLQTKPKAMNFALPFLSGDIVGIYDAEDRPERDQLKKVVSHFAAAPGNVACLQGRLDFFNSRENWISRCFTVDYAMWFRVMLKGVQRLSIPIPLGGTTVFFRRTALLELGGWDAHNVTEDAELGMRLVRFGYRCEMLDSTTWEEANSHPIRWIRQRSRWLKGYAMTWMSHMRSPKRLWRDLTPRGFFGFQTILLAGLTSHLATPLFLGLWAASFGLTGLAVDSVPNTFWYLFITIMIFGEISLQSVAITAIWSKERRHLLPYLLTLPFYWLLGMVAAYKAIIEVIFAPFYWDKTSHGHTDQD